MKPTRLPPLKSLIGFEATARLGSVSKAARELHLTPPAITHQIQSLEHSLGQLLFIRDNRQLVLTAAGEIFYPFAAGALQQVQQGVEALEVLAGQEEPLKVQAYITAAIRLIGPRIARFQQRFADIGIQLDSATRWDFDPELADVALVYLEQGGVTEHAWQGLFPYSIRPICAPQMATQLQASGIEAMLSVPRISVHTEEQHWESWLCSVGLNEEILTPSLSVDTLAIALEMALSGEGVALINGPFAQRELAQGSLVIPFDRELTLGEWGLIYCRDNPRRAQIEAFVEWLKADLANS